MTELVTIAKRSKTTGWDTFAIQNDGLSPEDLHKIGVKLIQMAEAQGAENAPYTLKPAGKLEQFVTGETDIGPVFGGLERPDEAEVQVTSDRRSRSLDDGGRSAPPVTSE